MGVLCTTCPLSPLQMSQPTLDTFQELLHKHPDVFYPSRTAKALQLHWQLMKQYYLLDDQTGEPCSPPRASCGPLPVCPNLCAPFLPAPSSAAAPQGGPSAQFLGC